MFDERLDEIEIRLAEHERKAKEMDRCIALLEQGMEPLHAYPLQTHHPVYHRLTREQRRQFRDQMMIRLESTVINL